MKIKNFVFTNILVCKFFFYLTLILATFSFLNVCYAGKKISVHGGDLVFNGEVVKGACSLSSESQDMVVQLGPIRSNQFDGNGSWADPVMFSILLNDCDLSVSKGANLIINGLTDSHDPQVFNTQYGAGSASGVGLGIFDQSQNILIPNTQPTSYTALQSGNTRLDFVAKYRATKRKVIPGNASTKVWFSVIYP